MIFFLRYTVFIYHIIVKEPSISFIIVKEMEGNLIYCTYQSDLI